MNWARAKVTNQSRLIPRDCPYCKRFMDHDFLMKRLEEVRSQKSQRMKESLKLAKELGEPVGRPRKGDYDLLRKLRAEGLSLRKIAQKAGCSLSIVQRALRTASK